MRFPKNGRGYYSFRLLLINLNKDLFNISSKIDSNQYDFDEFDYLVMALEDRRYLKHCGVDVFSVFRECIKMISLRKHGGASTIDMQMVRTLTGYKDLTFKRKIYEMVLAILVNFRFSKHQIMKCYMDNAFFGSHLIGIRKTSNSLYGKDVHELEVFEKARIAAMLLKPRPKKPTDAWELAVDSRAIYAQSMRRFVKKSHYQG